MKKIIQSINNENLSKNNDAKSNIKIYDSIIDKLFHIIHFFSNIIILISISKFIRVLIYSNIFSNIYLRMIIE